MAELYPCGNNRIFYRSQGFVEWLTVTVDVVNPDLSIVYSIGLNEFGGGLYYFDYDFSLEGTYIGIFYEDGEKKTSQSYSTRSLPSRRVRGNVLD